MESTSIQAKSMNSFKNPENMPITPLYSFSAVGVFCGSDVDSTFDVGVRGVAGVEGQGEPRSLICEDVTLSLSSSLKLYNRKTTTDK